jgi:hypothetical protein
MSTENQKKLGTLRLSEGEKQAIAEMVESDGFKVWKKKVMPNRELQIAGACLQAVDSNGLFRAKGQSYENGKAVKSLEEIAADWNKNQLDEDASE